jgi:DNA-directed RNA polymerase specialized sigma subunit
MDAREYLSEVNRLEIKLENLQSEIEYYENLASGLRSMDYSSERVMTSIKPDKMSSAVVKVLEKRDEYEAALDDCMRRRKNIIDEINSLKDDRYVRLLYRKYVQGKTLAAIAREMGYSQKHISRLHSDALDEFSRTIDMGN